MQWWEKGERSSKHRRELDDQGADTSMEFIWTNQKKLDDGFAENSPSSEKARGRRHRWGEEEEEEKFQKFKICRSVEPIGDRKKLEDWSTDRWDLDDGTTETLAHLVGIIGDI